MAAALGGVDVYTLWPVVYAEVQVTLLVGGGASLVSSLLLCCVYATLKRVRRTPGWLVFRAALCDVLVSAGFVSLYFYGDNRADFTFRGVEFTYLLVLLISIAALEVASHAWRVLMYIDLAAIYRNPFRPNRVRWSYPCFVLCVAGAVVVGTVVPLFTHNAQGAWWTGGRPADEAALLLLSVGFVFLPFGLFVICGGALHAGVSFLVSRALKAASDDGTAAAASITFLARQRVMRHCTAYLVVHALQLSAALLLTLYLIWQCLAAPSQPWPPSPPAGPADAPPPPALPGPSPQLPANQVPVWHMLALLLSGGPVLSFLGWLVINDVLYLYLGMCSFTKPWRVVAEQRARTQRLTTLMPRASLSRNPSRASLLSLAPAPAPAPAPASAADARGAPCAASARLAPTSARATDGAPVGGAFFERGAPRAVHPGDELRRVLTTAREARAARAATLQGIEEVGFKEELRFEVVYDVACGIGKLAQRELQEELLASGHHPVELLRASVDLGVLASPRSNHDFGDLAGQIAGFTSPRDGYTCARSPASSGDLSGAAARWARSRAAVHRDGLLGTPLCAASPPPPSQPSSQPPSQPLPHGSLRSPQPRAGTLAALAAGALQPLRAAPLPAAPKAPPGCAQPQGTLASPPPPPPPTAAPPPLPWASPAATATRAGSCGSGAALRGLLGAHCAGPCVPPTVPGHACGGTGETGGGGGGGGGGDGGGARCGEMPVPRSQSDTHLHAVRGALLAPDRSQAQHYEAATFRAIRVAFGVHPATYARAFPDDLSEHDSRWRRKLRESVSEGASGSFFFRVVQQDGHGGAVSRFIVKQISRAEKQTLMAILPAYARHVAARRGRSLIQYLGCHSVSLRWQCSDKVYFVVMRNFLPVRAWLTFDLKGATANRRALAARFLHGVHAAADPATGSVAYGTLRDWEWLDIAMVVDVSEAAKAALADTVAADAAFLSAAGLLDYSLLVGIHRLPPLPAAEREARIGALEAQGGHASLDRQKVYFFGIIDVLERYTLRWQAQHTVLTTGYHLLCRADAARGISAMPPSDYAERFETFVLHEVLQLPLPLSDEAMARASPRRRGERGTLARGRRWGDLWQRRRRGLIKVRIECERADYIRRIAELEGRVVELQPADESAVRVDAQV